MKLLFAITLICISWSGHADSVCARNYITLRKGPGTQYPVSWKVAKHMPFLRLERKGGWVKLQDLEGEVHWGRAADVTSQTRCVVVKTNVASLRKEPSTSAVLAELRTLDRYTPLKRLESSGEWLQVEDEAGRLAWIHETNVWKPVMVNSFSF